MPNTYFPATHSILSTSALISYVHEHYDIGDIRDCRFFNLGLNDTYLLQTRSDKYILRVYRVSWRTTFDILYELDVLLHLHRKHVPVSFPLPMRDGGLLSTLNTLEGPRQVVLFTYAEGDPPPISSDEARKHIASDMGKLWRRYIMRWMISPASTPVFPLTLITCLINPCKQFFLCWKNVLMMRHIFCVL